MPSIRFFLLLALVFALGCPETRPDDDDATISDDDDASGDDDDDDVTDCACGSSVVGDGAPAWGLLLLPLLGFVRRRRR